MASFALLLGALAALLTGLSKTGIPGVGMPAIALMAGAFPEATKLSVGALVPLLILGDVIGIGFYRRHVDWHRLLEVLPYIVVGMIPGYVVLQCVDSAALRVVIGILIAALLGLHLAGHRIGWDAMLNRWWFTSGMGLLAGFGTIVGNAAGPAMSIYLVGKKLDKHEFIGTSAWLFFLVNSSKVPFQWMMGIITATTLQFDLWLIPALVIGALGGSPGPPADLATSLQRTGAGTGSRCSPADDPLLSLSPGTRTRGLSGCRASAWGTHPCRWP